MAVSYLLQESVGASSIANGTPIGLLLSLTYTDFVSGGAADFLLQENGDKIILEVILQKGLIHMHSRGNQRPFGMDDVAGVLSMRRKSNQRPLAMDDEEIL